MKAMDQNGKFVIKTLLTFIARIKIFTNRNMLGKCWI